MKKLSKICVRGGGASLLIIVLAVSICLAVLPQNLTNEYEKTAGVNAADTEIIDGYNYAVLNVYSNTTVETIDNFMTDNDYVKLVLQADWVASSTSREVLWVVNHGGLGKWVIFDFNGHTITCQAPVTQWGILGEHIEIWDSVGTGRVVGDCYLYNRVHGNLDFSIYGGTFEGNLNFAVNSITTEQIKFAIYGGVIQGELVAIHSHAYAQVSGEIAGGYVGGVIPGIVERVQVAPYLVTEADGTIRGYDYYTVSPSNSYSGAYNYAYGYKWDLSLAEMLALPISADQTHYLWARDANQGYQYLHLQYAATMVEVGNVNNLATWTKYENGNHINVNSQLVDGDYQNTVTITPESGWELLGIEVKVPANTELVLSADVVAPDFICQSGTAGLFFGITTEKPHGGGTTDQVQEVLARTYIAPNYQGQATVRFNTGNHTTVYLLINGGYCKDGQGDVSFSFSNVHLQKQVSAWRVAA